MDNNYKYLATNNEEESRIDDIDKKHSIRSDFQRDRDRIMYSRAFRRLSGKTQVFLTGTDDHARTRLTHTLEVAQIARTIAKALELNEDLTEAIALGHDIGHTPFGHVGERMLNRIMNGCYKIRDFNDFNDFNETKNKSNIRGFKHNWQSVRVATELEGNMNLTRYTLWGMLNHSKLKNKECDVKDKNKMCLFRHEEKKGCIFTDEEDLKSDVAIDFYKDLCIETKYGRKNVYDEIKDKWSFEGLVVEIADEIAQRHHDIEDALEYKIIDKNELIDKFRKIFDLNEYNKYIEDKNKEYEDYFKEKYSVLDFKNADEETKGLKNRIQQNLKELVDNIEEHNKNFNDIEQSLHNDSIDLCKSKFAKFIINILTTDVIMNTKNNFEILIKQHNIKSNEDFFAKKKEIDYDEKVVCYTYFMKKNDEELQVFLKDRILNSHQAQTMDGVGQHVIKELFKAYTINPQQLPDKTIIKLFQKLYEEDELKDYKDGDLYNVGKLRTILSKYHYNIKKLEPGEDGYHHDKYNYKYIDYDEYKVYLLRTVCDYIAGMTDKYTIEQHRKLYNIL